VKLVCCKYILLLAWIILVPGSEFLSLSLSHTYTHPSYELHCAGRWSLVGAFTNIATLQELVAWKRHISLAS